MADERSGGHKDGHSAQTWNTDTEMDWDSDKNKKTQICTQPHRDRNRPEYGQAGRDMWTDGQTPKHTDTEMDK